MAWCNSNGSYGVTLILQINIFLQSIIISCQLKKFNMFGSKFTSLNSIYWHSQRVIKCAGDRACREWWWVDHKMSNIVSFRAWMLLETISYDLLILLNKKNMWLDQRFYILLYQWFLTNWEWCAALLSPKVSIGSIELSWTNYST